MFKKVNIGATIMTGITAGVLFSIPVFFYIQSARYLDSWLLYLGSFLFLAVIAVHTYRDNISRGKNESTVALVFASHMATLTGIVCACILSFTMLWAMVPGYLESGVAEKTLTGEPVNTIRDKTDGLSIDVFMAATLINFSVGSIVGIVLPFYTKRNQTKDSREPTPFHQKGIR
jgi:hypothetical protein